MPFPCSSRGNERVRRLGDVCLSDSLHLYTLRRIRMYQQIMLVGSLSGDPKMRLTQVGTTQNKTIRFDVPARERLAETVHPYMTRGQRVWI